MKSQYIIILATLITLIATMLLLAFIEKDQREKNEDFWSVYFVYPLTEENDFVIDNKSEDATFTYEIHSGENALKSNSVEIKKDSRKLIKVTEEGNISPIEITIKSNNDIKTIEKK